MSRRNLMIGGARLFHRGGAWVFDRAGPLSSTLARLGEPVHRLLFPSSLLRDPSVPMTVNGFRLYHPGRPSYHLQMLAMGMHDRDVSGFIRGVAGPETTFIDIGAHIGYFSLLCARIGGPGCRIWAFEPSSNSVAILRTNVQANRMSSQIQVIASAVGDCVGTVSLFEGATDPMLSSLHAGAARGSGPLHDEKVPCTTLDHWAERNGWPRIDVVKLDVEGNEVAVLAGMRQVCRRNRHLVLIVEFNERTLGAAGETAATFWAGIEACGFDNVTVAGGDGSPVSYPEDLKILRRRVRRQGNGLVNLVCTWGSG
jgi:FkbM family methyltransferase